MHSPRYYDLRRHFENGLWADVSLRKAVVVGWITEEEYENITGKEYVPVEIKEYARPEDYEAALKEFGVDDE